MRGSELSVGMLVTRAIVVVTSGSCMSWAWLVGLVRRADQVHRLWRAQQVRCKCGDLAWGGRVMFLASLYVNGVLQVT